MKVNSWEQEYKISENFWAKGDRLNGWHIVDKENNIVYTLHNKEWLYFKKLFVPSAPGQYRGESARDDLYLINVPYRATVGECALYRIRDNGGILDIKMIASGLSMHTYFVAPWLLISQTPKFPSRYMVYLLTSDDELKQIYLASRVNIHDVDRIMIIQYDNGTKDVVDIETLQRLVPYTLSKFDYVTVIDRYVAIMKEEEHTFKWTLYKDGKAVKYIEFDREDEDEDEYDYDGWHEVVAQMIEKIKKFLRNELVGENKFKHYRPI